ncbi:unnamed protein product [Prunus armeniaca]
MTYATEVIRSSSTVTPFSDLEKLEKKNVAFTDLLLIERKEKLLHIIPIEDGDIELFCPEVPPAQGEQKGAADEVVEAIELAAEVDELVVAAGEQVATTDE